MNRREFLGLAAASALAPAQKPEAKADAMVLIWLPGGIAQTDTWDPKRYTPFQAGMKGSDLLGTCRPVPTKADGIHFGEGLESYRRMEWAAAAAAFERALRIDPADGPSRTFLGRCAGYRADPPPPSWGGVHVMHVK